MARTMLAVVREAVLASAAEDCPETGETGAAAPQPEDVKMSGDQKPAGGDSKNAGISQAEHDAAVKAATETGRAEGAKAASDRLSAALGADGVKGDAGRMSAALELATKSPGMSGEDVAAFVSANVAASVAKGSEAAGYEAGRLAAAPHARPSGDKPGSKKATIDTGGIYAARRKQTQEG